MSAVLKELEPVTEFIDEVCGIYFRSIILAKKGMRVNQHIHDHDHANYCGSGSAEFYENGVFIRNVYAGQAIAIPAHRYHEFVALEDNTRLTCVHDVASAESVKAKGV